MTVTLTLTIEDTYAVINSLASLQNNIQRQVAEQMTQNAEQPKSEKKPEAQS